MFISCLLYAQSAMATPSVEETSFHLPLHRALQAYVHSNGVDYKGLKESRALNTYIERLRAPLPPQSTRQARLTYWINAYNALTLAYVVRLFPKIKTVKTAIDGEGDYAFFKKFEIAF